MTVTVRGPRAANYAETSNCLLNHPVYGLDRPLLCSIKAILLRIPILPLSHGSQPLDSTTAVLRLRSDPAHVPRSRQPSTTCLVLPVDCPARRATWQLHLRLRRAAKAPIRAPCLAGAEHGSPLLRSPDKEPRTTRAKTAHHGRYLAPPHATLPLPAATARSGRGP
jgi:hypothetical protein